MFGWFLNADRIIFVFNKTIEKLNSYSEKKKKKADKHKVKVGKLLRKRREALNEHRKADRYAKKLKEFFGDDDSGVNKEEATDASNANDMQDL
jgi:ElaB/YqjD/DUF883 family membrane-anchored ribosome-binding protein